MLEMYIREFIAIGKFLRLHGECRKGRILVDKKDLENMLNRNKYDTAANKLNIWKRLHWILTEDDSRVTKRVYNSDTKKYQPKVVLDAGVLEQLEQLVKH